MLTKHLLWVKYQTRLLEKEIQKPRCGHCPPSKGSCPLTQAAPFFLPSLLFSRGLKVSKVPVRSWFQHRGSESYASVEKDHSASQGRNRNRGGSSGKWIPAGTGDRENLAVAHLGLWSVCLHHSLHVPRGLSAMIFTKVSDQKSSPGISLVVQWLRLCSQCRGPRFSPW